jgi:hypothetical protein
MPAKPSNGPLTGYSGTYLDCRNLGHVWGTVGFYRLNGEVRRRLDCGRCGTERLDRWLSNGDRRGASYSYVDGYRIESDEPVTAHGVRVEVLARARVYASEAAMLAAMTKGAR